MNKSHFDIDYSKNSVENFTKFHPSFILIDEGAYGALFDWGDISDTLMFLEGKGKLI